MWDVKSPKTLKCARSVIIFLTITLYVRVCQYKYNVKTFEIVDIVCKHLSLGHILLLTKLLIETNKNVLNLNYYSISVKFSTLIKRPWSKHVIKIQCEKSSSNKC